MWQHVIVSILFTFQFVFSETCPPYEDITPCFCSTFGGSVSIHCHHLESLKQLTDSVQGLSGRKISFFEIKNSNFEYIPHDLFENVTVKEIDISHSNISRIGNLGESQFKGLENSLEILKFTSAFSRSKPFANVFMEHLNRLTTLELRGSYVEFIHSMWFKQGPKNLKIIRFVQGNIRVVGHSAFNSLTNLQIIDLSDNELTYIPRWALPEPALHLEELNLERNKFDALPEDMFTSIPNLKLVNLELNEISTIDETTWRPVWNHIEMLNIDYNPMICDKKIKWMYESNEDLERKLVATCYKPFTLMDRELHSLSLKELK